MKKGIISLIVIIVAAAIVILGYIYLSSTSMQEVTGTEKEEILLYAEPVVDNMLIAYNEGDYTSLITDFNEEMKNALTEGVFMQNRELVSSLIGNYVSRGTPIILESGISKVLIYSAEFEKESGVEVRIVFTKYGDNNLVSGFWYNSPKLRG